MKCVKDILFELDLLVPPSKVLSGDNCGLLIGNLHSPVTCCVIALDITNEVIDIANKQKAELIIVHHPVIYNPLMQIKSDNIVHRLIRNNISVLCAHTNLDIIDEGVNGVFAKQLNLSSVKVLKGSEGIGRVGRLKNDLSGLDLAKFAKAMLNAPSARIVNPHNTISKVAVAGGACGQYIEAAFEDGADAFITGEVKHSHYIYAINSKKTLITLGHHYTEVHVLHSLMSRLKTVLNEVVFIVDEHFKVTEI